MKSPLILTLALALSSQAWALKLAILPFQLS